MNRMSGMMEIGVVVRCKKLTEEHAWCGRRCVRHDMTGVYILRCYCLEELARNDCLNCSLTNWCIVFTVKNNP